MFFSKTKKKWFTLAEVIVVCSLFAVMVVWIIFAINRAFIYMDNTRLATRASNLARWWVEMIYNLRDSNRRVQSWEKDKYWLNTWKRANDGKGLASADNMLTKWYYTIKEWVTSDGDYYAYAEPLSVSDDFYDIEWFFSDSYSSQRANAELKFEWYYPYYTWSQIETWDLEELLDFNYIRFYRILRVYGVYKKNTTETSAEIPSTSKTALQNSDPKELRFCVKVFYENNQWQHSSELCSIMTNFME